jgi:NAD(P)-dependent dehydrogenase (short-subunit alcohol dehydrogenase family)
MKIVVIGASGTIGSAVSKLLEAGHEVVRASRNGAVSVDLGDRGSIAALFASVGAVDAVVCCAASVKLAPFESLSDDAFCLDLASKLLGQVSVVRHSLPYLRDRGSITLTTGQIPAIPGSAAGALTNAGLEAFVRAVALEMPRGMRINAISPGWVRETLVKMGREGSEGTPVSRVARSYVQAVEGAMQGQTLRPSDQ